MIIRRKHWYPVDAGHRCKGVGSEFKNFLKIYIYIITLLPFSIEMLQYDWL